MKDELIDLIECYATSKVFLSWSGSYPPEQIEQIENDFEKSKQKLMEFIDDLPI